MLHRLMDGTRFGIFEDFTGGLDSTKWTTLAPQTGTAVANAGIDGYVAMTPTGGGPAATNDEIYLYGKEIFLLKRQRPIYSRCRLQFIEAAQNKANVLFGFMSAVGVKALIDNGGGVRQSGIFCGCYKVASDSYWRVQSRDAFDFEDSVSNAPAGSITSTETIDGIVTAVTPVEELEIFIDDPAPPYQVKDRVMVATFRRNGVPLLAGNGAPIRHELSILNAVEMALVVGVKNGTTTAELLVVDYLHGDQLRE